MPSMKAVVIHISGKQPMTGVSIYYVQVLNFLTLKASLDRLWPAIFLFKELSLVDLHWVDFYYNAAVLIIDCYYENVLILCFLQCYLAISFLRDICF